ncbi:MULTISPECIES: stage II sporulation protein R [Clostridia]|uniref:stage II sporulation protein R n=1 Tax=Clostridia TaxID=186801 RepID=UPI000EA3FDCC|nr:MULTISPECIES: stage II sporulation protein R [Clostridia]NBJ69686.1 stage II sporulation protein R [Roseburia sp. 1XD42-34]RKI78052.1 stage II sporulation protein R [Clostridium sp. 1xD42-85]
MKKLVFFVVIFLIGFLSIPGQVFSQKPEEKSLPDQEDYQVIPDEAIRLRILANSDNESDQQLKRNIRDRVNEEITSWVEDMTDMEQARNLIEKRIPEINQIIRSVLEESGVEQNFEVTYGKAVSFPAKIYGSYVYPAGKYEAVLITIGEGKGDNWWCVLFPPLCFLDFSNGTSAVSAETMEEETKEEEEQKEDTKVTFFLFEWLGWS